MNDAPPQHNHPTRDIKPVGVCPACDLHHGRELDQLRRQIDIGLAAVDPRRDQLLALIDEVKQRRADDPKPITTGGLDGLILSKVVDDSGKLTHLAARVKDLPALGMMLEASAVEELWTALGLVLGKAAERDKLLRLAEVVEIWASGSYDHEDLLRAFRAFKGLR